MSDREEMLRVVMPVYNEETCIAAVIDQWLPILRASVDGLFTVHVLDDGSTDGTAKVLSGLLARWPELRVKGKPNSGHGQTCLLGYKTALEEGAQWILQIDSDGQCDPCYFAQFWSRRTEFPVMFGRRVKRMDGYARLVISRILRLITFLITRTWVKDANVPYRLMHRSALEPVVARIPDWFYLANIPVAVLLQEQTKICWIDIVFLERLAKASDMPRLAQVLRQAKSFIADLGRWQSQR